MIYPSADRLEENVGSRYTLVILAAKRARQLREGAQKLINTSSTNPLTIALEEIAAGKITCQVATNDDLLVPKYVAPEGLPAIESAQEEAAELTGETPKPQDEAARVAQLLEVPAEESAEEPVVEEVEAAAVAVEEPAVVEALETREEETPAEQAEAEEE